MFDPFFGIALVGTPIAVVFLIIEARMNASAIPSVGTCLVAAFAGFGVFDWLMTLGLLLFGQNFDQGGRALSWAAGGLAALTVGVPFLLSARGRRRTQSAD
jgi:hypothetical protein